MDKDYKFVFRDFEENEFIIQMILFDENPQLREFMNGAIGTTELCRIDEEQALKYSSATLKSIKMSK